MSMSISMSIETQLLIVWSMWYVYVFGVPLMVYSFFNEMHRFLHSVIVCFDKTMYPDYYDDEEEETLVDKSDDKDKAEDKEEDKVKQESKYEDKYLKDIQRLNKEWIFTEEELIDKSNKQSNLVNCMVDAIKRRIKQNDDYIEKYNNPTYEDEEEDDDDESDYDDDSEYDDEEEKEEEEYDEEKEKEEERQMYESILLENQTLRLQIESEEGLLQLKNEVEKEATEYIINKKTERLKDSFVIEKTPQGNVLMTYDNNRKSFRYYSDFNIPYKHLEVVCRKFIKSFDCRPLYVDMDEELRLFEEKWNKEQERIKEENKKIEANALLTNKVEDKKNVFAKFKSYNKEAVGKISMATAPKNSIPNKSLVESKENYKTILKEKSNRFTHEGKFANFNFLKKIDKTVCNKKLAVSFADYKKMNKQ